MQSYTAYTYHACGMPGGYETLSGFAFSWQCQFIVKSIETYDAGTTA